MYFCIITFLLLIKNIMLNNLHYKILTITIFSFVFTFAFFAQAKIPKHCKRLKNGRLSCKLRSIGKHHKKTKHTGIAFSKLKHYKKALSIGVPWDGKLYRGQKIPLIGKGYKVVKRTIKRGHIYGLPELISLIKYAASSVTKMYPHSILTVADLSKRSGGPVPGHKSHQSGRDIDIGFYVTDKSHRYKLFTTTFIPFDMFARGKGKYANMLFDLERNWKLIEALLTYKKTKVEMIFVSEELKDMLLNYAEATGKNKHLIHQASKILRYFPHHDDHFHVRIACPEKQPFCK